MKSARGRLLTFALSLLAGCQFNSAHVSTLVDGSHLAFTQKQADPARAGAVNENGSLGSLEIPRTGWKPWDLAEADSGRIYLSDSSHHRLLEITATGIISLAAGNDEPGDRDGRALDARFREPLGLSWSPAGLLIADSGNRRIRRLVNGTVSTELISYPLERPIAVAADSLNRLYVGDAGSGVILRKAPQQAPEVLLKLPPYRLLQQMKLAPDGRLYFSDNEGLWRINVGQGQTAETSPTTLLLQPSDGFGRLAGLAFWRATLWLSDVYGHRLLSYDGHQLQPQSGEGLDPALKFPGALAPAADGSLLLAEPDADRIRRLRLVDGKWQASQLAVSGTQGFGVRHDGEDLSLPHAVLYDRLRKQVLVCDYFNRRLLRINAKGEATPWLDKSGLDLPIGLAQAPDGRIFVADAHRIHEIGTDDSHKVLAGSGDAGFRDGKGAEARFWLPWGMDVAADGSLVVADHGNHAIRRIRPDGTVSTLAGGQGEPGMRNGPGREARFYYPSDVLAYPDGSILVADSWNHQLRLINPLGVVSTFAGGAGPGLREGLRFKAQFYLPSALTRGQDGTIYIADSWNHRIRKLNSGGQVTTVAGKGHLFNWDGGVADGNGDSARFDEPRGLDLTPDGKLLVADTVNNRIRLIEAP